MTPAVSALAKSLLLPPGIVVLGLIISLVLLLATRRRYLGAGLLALSLATLLLSSLPAMSQRLAASVEPAQALDKTVLDGAGAIVVLGCGRNTQAPEYGGDSLAECSLARLSYAARLHADTQLPILVSGGRVWHEPQPEAKLMANTLRRRFHISPLWVETYSRNTWENALYSTGMLRQSGVDTVLLVTHALHMKRAAWAFRQMGLKVIPAPTYFQSRADRRPGWLNWLPSARSLLLTRDSLREILGLAWYRWAVG